MFLNSGTALGVLLSMKAFAAASQNDFWPSPFPSIGNNSVRPELTGKIRQKRHSLNLNNLEGLDGEHISRAVVLLHKARERAGTISLEIEGGPLRGIHQCEILGRGATALTQQPGWVSGAIQEAAGTTTT